MTIDVDLPPRVLTNEAAGVLLVDLTAQTVVYASPAARELAEISLPVGIDDWGRAAGLQSFAGGVLSESAGPLASVAAGRPVRGEPVLLRGEEGAATPLWVTGFPLADGAVPGAVPAELHERALVVFLRLSGPLPVEVREATGGDLRERAVFALDVSLTVSDPLQPDNPLVWVNPAFTRVTGYQPADVLGRNCRFLQGPATNRESVARLREAIEQRRSATVVLLNYRKDGSLFWNEVALSPVLDDAGVLTNFVAVQTDVTARVIAEEEQARLHALERQAREVAEEQRREAEEARARSEQAQQRLALLAEGTALLTATLDDADAVLDRLVRLVVPLVGDLCFIDVVEGDASDASGTRVRRVAAIDRDRPDGRWLIEALGQDVQRVIPGSLLDQVLRSGRSLHLDPWPRGRGVVATEHTPEQAALLKAMSVSSGIVVPLRTRRVATGTLTLLRREAASGGRGTPFTADDISLVEDLARRAALVLDNVRLYGQEHEVAATLQRSLLPTLPELPGLTLAARYLPAGASAEVGGDWYDAFTIASGATALVIGDVVGHDLAAAARMGRIRNLLRGCAFDAAGPAAAMQRMDRLSVGLATGLSRDPERLGDLATAVLMILSPVGGGMRLTWSNAGHIPPLVLHPDGGTEWLDDPSDVMLGVGTVSKRLEDSVVLPVGTVLVLATDGLIERRGAPLEQGLTALRQAVEGTTTRDVDGLCDAVLAELGTDDDDICLLAVRIGEGAAVGGGASVQLHQLSATTLRGGPAAGREGRSFLRGWCAAAGLAEDITETACLLATELITNAVQHGRSDVELSAAVSRTGSDSRMLVTVADDNSRMPVPQPADSDALDGRGLAIVEALSTRWGFREQGLGKVVWFEVALDPPAP